MLLSNSQKMREADNIAINRYGIDSLLLMRRAAQHIVDAVHRKAAPPAKVVCICGAGNNGGDGVAAASILILEGYEVCAYLVGNRNKLSKDCAAFSEILKENGGCLIDYDTYDSDIHDNITSAAIIIDAIFGIGLCRNVSGMAESAIAAINSSTAYKISADIPSGVDADTGLIMGCSVRADETITFSMAKPGHFSDPGSTCCGRVKVCSIGIPNSILINAVIDTEAFSFKDICIPERPPLSHKGDFGKLLILGGCTGYTGAPTMSAKAALKLGAGLVSLGVPDSIYEITAAKNDEAMPFPLPAMNGKFCKASAEEALEKAVNCDAVLIGPGLGRSDDVDVFVKEMVSSKTQLIIDADALFTVGKDMSVLEKCTIPPVLTPHEGEFIRLGGCLSGNRIKDASEFAAKHKCILVLKGHRTVTALPDGKCIINTSGGPELSKGGSGDVLAGMISALVCIMPPEKAVPTAVFIHGLAGELAKEELTEHCVLANDIIRYIPEAIKQINKLKEV